MPVERHDLLRLRLDRQLLDRPVARFGPAEVVAWMGAVQAQDLPGARWAIALRARGATGDEVEAAVIDRAVVRTWPMRGTLHFVAASDVRWMLRYLTPRVLGRWSGRHAQLDLDAESFAQARLIAEQSLSGSVALTRAEMLEAFEAGGLSTQGQRGYHMLACLAQQAVICFGPIAGKQPTFVLLDEWLPADASAPAPATEEEAFGLLAEHFFRSHGPATVRDLARWAGITLTEARRGTARAGALESITFAGAEYLLGESADPGASHSPPAVRLLPGFDEYLIGYADRRLVFGDMHDRYHSRISRNGVLAATVVSGGEVVGVWRRSARARSVEIALDTFRALRPAEKKSAIAEAERYGDFIGLPARLTF